MNKKEYNLTTLMYIQIVLIALLFSYLIHIGVPLTGILIVGVLFTAFTLVTHIRSMSMGMVLSFLDKKLYTKLKKMSDRYRK